MSGTIIASSGKKMLIDCGSDARFSLAEWSQRNALPNPEIDAVYISHFHSDHIGGLEWLAFQSYFSPYAARPKLFMVEALAKHIWDRSLRAGLACIEDKIMGLSDYFEPIVVTPGVAFQWENFHVTPFRTIHVNNPIQPMYSFGVIIHAVEQALGYLFTTDTVLDQNLIDFLTKKEPEIHCIFQDCETSHIHTGVHAHYNELSVLPEKLRRKMWLYHYNPNPPYRPKEDGFLGFVEKGQRFA